MPSKTAAKLLRSRIQVPTLPAVAQRVQQLMRDPDVGTGEIGDLVAEDPTIAARVLRIANSAFYGLQERCVSTRQACAVLGLRVLRNVVTQAAVIEGYEHLRAIPGFDLDDLWKHSVLTAQLSSLLGKASRRELGLRPEELYACGLLHDLGQVVLLEGLVGDYVSIWVDALSENVPLHVVERERLGVSHTDVGALVARRWNLPDQVVAAIQFHHGPRERVAEDPIVSLIAHANLLARRAAAGEVEAARATIDEQTARLIAVADEDVAATVEFALENHASVVI